MRPDNACAGAVAAHQMHLKNHPKNSIQSVNGRKVLLWLLSSNQRFPLRRNSGPGGGGAWTHPAHSPAPSAWHSRMMMQVQVPTSTSSRSKRFGIHIGVGNAMHFWLDYGNRAFGAFIARSWYVMHVQTWSRPVWNER
mmetsp:Transcript_56546/g.106060  ORF Transcript_56546/g.106060 Transcript_56546/m.106060 type:complete len:138 (+) Transcript_56546:67-480(+)